MDEARVEISRPGYTQDRFNAEFVVDDTEDKPLKEQVANYAKNIDCSRGTVWTKFLSLLPFIDVLRSYSLKKNVVGDVIAGMCVAVIHIPQSMGFAVITSVPPVYGLYSSIYPILLYFIFGTSRHISVGTMAVISIMIGAVVDRENDDFVSDLSANATKAERDDEKEDFRVDIAMSVTLLIGFIQLGMYVMRLGILATFMSTSFIAGFMSGAGFHIATSQVPFMLGISIPRQVGAFRFLKNWYWILHDIPEINVADLITSIICVIVLVACKEYLNEPFKKKLKIPIPAELLVVVFGTMISYLADINDRYDVKIIEDIPLGLPSPSVPTMHHANTYIMDAFAMAIVSFAVSMSLSKSMSSKHHYAIDQNQEMLAHGIMHSVGACFSSFGGAAAPPRTLVHDSSGGKTQVGALVSAAIILLVVLALGPLFEALPYSVLGSICTIAILPLFKQIRELPQYWKVNKYDFTVFLVTLLSVIILDVDYGLYIGFGISLLTIVIATHRATGSRMVQVHDTEILIPVKLMKDYKTSAKQSAMVFKFRAPLYFANVESFKQQLFQETFNPNDKCAEAGDDVMTVMVGEDSRGCEGSFSDITTSTIDKMEQNQANGHSNGKITRPEDVTKHLTNFVVLDCGAVTYIDGMGLNTLKQVSSRYKAVDTQVLFACCSHDVHALMVKNDVTEKQNFFATTIDALTHARQTAED